MTNTELQALRKNDNEYSVISVFSPSSNGEIEKGAKEEKGDKEEKRENGEKGEKIENDEAGREHDGNDELLRRIATLERIIVEKEKKEKEIEIEMDDDEEEEEEGEEDEEEGEEEDEEDEDEEDEEEGNENENRKNKLAQIAQVEEVRKQLNLTRKMFQLQIKDKSAEITEKNTGKKAEKNVESATNLGGKKVKNEKKEKKEKKGNQDYKNDMNSRNERSFSSANVPSSVG